MILLYTGAQSPGSQQPESLKSLGGYISSSQVFNIDQNLFNDIEIPENKFIGTRMLCLKNTFAQKIEEVKIWTDFDSELLDIKIAALKPSINKDCNYSYFEQISSPIQKPLYAKLNTQTVDSKIFVGDMEPNALVGIWISLELKKDDDLSTFIQPGNSCTEQSLEDLKQNRNKKYDFNLQISWD